MSATETDAPPAPPAPSKPTKNSGTDYLVLQRGETNWAELKTVRATSAQAAVHAAIGNSPAASGTYVAVPARSWKPVKVKVEQISRVRLEDA